MSSSHKEMHEYKYVHHQNTPETPNLVPLFDIYPEI